MWPFKKAPVEKRQDSTSYTDALVRALLAAATGDTAATAVGTAAAETAASQFARAFLMAKITPASPATRAVTPSVLANIVREMLTLGESMYLIRVEDGEVELVPVGTWDVTGGSRKQDWRVRCDTFGPSRSSTTTVPYDGVVHCMWSYDLMRPWIGVGPFSRASVTGSLHGGLDRTLGHEARGPVGSLLPVPQSPTDDDEDADPLGDLRRDIRNLKGGAALLESTSANWGEASNIGAPRKDWVASRIGPNPPAPLIDLQEKTFDQLLAACGVPPGLHGRGGRCCRQTRGVEAFFLHGSVTPVAEIVAEELRVKLESPDLTDRLRSVVRFSDLQGRARSLFSRMVNAGVPLDDARRLAGLA